MLYTFATMVIADEVLGNFSDLPRKLGTTIFALRDDRQVYSPVDAGSACFFGGRVCVGVCVGAGVLAGLFG